MSVNAMSDTDNFLQVKVCTYRGRVINGMSGIDSLLQLKVRACQVHLTINALKHSNYDLALVSKHT